MTWLRTLVVVAVVFTFGYCAGYAEASPPPEGWGAASLKVAQQYWGTTSPPNCITQTITWEAPPEWEGYRLAAATAPTTPEPCVMWVGTFTSAYELCRAVVHEYGHWMGIGWTTDPHSIMYDGEVIGSATEIGAPWEPETIQGCWKLTHHPRRQNQ